MSWADLPDDEGIFDSDAPWAMQLVLRVERVEPPTHRAACEAVATAVVRLLADPRSVDGPWHARVAAWESGPIRKVVRRARGARFEAVGALPGVSVAHRGADVRALVPGPVDQAAPTVAKLQVGGTDLADDGDPAPITPGGLVIALTPHAALTTGKAAAQSGHAAQLAWWALGPADRCRWQQAGLAVRVLRPNAAGWRTATRRAVVRVRDAGYTEVAPGTVTALAWPEPV